MGEEAKINIPPRQISVNNDLEYANIEYNETEIYTKRIDENLFFTCLSCQLIV